MTCWIGNCWNRPSLRIIERQPVSKSTTPIKNTDRAVGAILSYHVVKTHGAEGLPDEHDFDFLQGLSRPEPRGFPGQRNFDSSRRRRQRLRRQRTFGRTDHRLSARTVDVCVGRKHHDWKRRTLWSDRAAKPIFAASQPSDLRFETLARWRSSKALAITAANT